MPLYERLLGRDDGGAPVAGKLAVHTFMAALAEHERGKLAKAEIVAHFGLSPAEEAELDTLVARIVPPVEMVSLGGYTVLTNVGATYDSSAPAKGLGFVRVETNGVTGVEVVVRYNKIGTGTLSWQLWDETAGNEIGVHNDAAAAGDNKEGVITTTLQQPLGPGTKTLRMRAKSTVATDDPVYYGSSLRIRRVNRLYSEVLHEILLLGDGENPVAGYSTPAQVKTRLGV